MMRYFADRFDADEKFYVFDSEQEGSEHAGPFDTLAEAKAKAQRLNEAPSPTILHLCAPNDANGNPQRCFVVFEAGIAAKVIDEGYEGERALSNAGYFPSMLTVPARINISAAEYARWLKIGAGEFSEVNLAETRLAQEHGR